MMEVPTSVYFTAARGERTLNPYIRVRDRDETPAAADIKRIIREAARGGLQFRGLVVDVKGAHRLIPATGSTNAFNCRARTCLPEHGGHVRHRRVISIGSGFSHGHTDWPVDFVSKPGVASVSPKTWRCRTNPEGGGTGVICWGETKCPAAGGELHIIFWRVLRVGFLPALVGVTLVVDSGSTPPFGKGETYSFHWTRAKNGRTESNVCRKAKTWIPSPFVPKDSDHPPQNLCSSPENH